MLENIPPKTVFMFFGSFLVIGLLIYFLSMSQENLMGSYKIKPKNTYTLSTYVSEDIASDVILPPVPPTVSGEPMETNVKVDFSNTEIDFDAAPFFCDHNHGTCHSY